MIYKFLTYIFLLCLLFNFIDADDIATAPDIHIPIFLKVITFDKKYSEKTKDGIVLHLIYQKNNKSSLVIKNDVVNYFNENNLTNFEGKNVFIKEFCFDNIKEIEKYIHSNNVQFAYLSSIKSISVKEINDLFIDNGILSFSASNAYSEEGTIVTCWNRGGKPLIVINLKAAKRTNIEFSSQLLKISKILE
ncbi:MAG: YfiR family protein [Candidatus Kapabacteria bacterium]|nr:YfiR family protein [Candidatus Kapabacteria bacterium]